MTVVIWQLAEFFWQSHKLLFSFFSSMLIRKYLEIISCLSSKEEWSSKRTLPAGLYWPSINLLCSLLDFSQVSAIRFPLSCLKFNLLLERWINNSEQTIINVYELGRLLKALKTLCKLWHSKILLFPWVQLFLSVLNKICWTALTNRKALLCLRYAEMDFQLPQVSVELKRRRSGFAQDRQTFYDER